MARVIPLRVPPLRERRGDIKVIAKHLLHQLAEEAALGEIGIDEVAVEVLRSYDWPGNVRELSNVLERIVSSLEGDTIHLRHLPFHFQRNRGKAMGQSEASLKEVQAGAEKEAIRYALESNNHNKAATAKMLGIHRTLLYKKMKKYNLPLGS